MGLAERLSEVKAGSGRQANETQSGRDEMAFQGSRNDLLDYLVDAVQAKLLANLGAQIHEGSLEQEELERSVFEAIQAVFTSHDLPLTTVDRARLVQDVTDEILGHGPLEGFLRDPAVTEIMVNGSEDVFIERSGRISKSSVKFRDERHLRRTIERIVARVGRRIDESSPMVDARLPDGSRVNAIVPPIAVDGPSLTIRKFAVDPFTSRDLASTGTISPLALELLEACVKGRLNMVISGGTGSGKTTTLNVLSSFIPSDERIITIEDSAELQLRQPHVVRLEARPPNVEGQGVVTVRDLVRNALRMRPDRIVVGEVRDEAALDMLQAMNTGHDGSLTTVHSNGPRDALSRIETMVLMSGMELPVRVIREQVVGAIHVIVHQERLRDGNRYITSVTEITGLEDGQISTVELFTFEYNVNGDKPLGQLISQGVEPHFYQKLKQRGVTPPVLDRHQ